MNGSNIILVQLEENPPAATHKLSSTWDKELKSKHLGSPGRSTLSSRLPKLYKIVSPKKKKTLKFPRTILNFAILNPNYYLIHKKLK